MIAAAHHSMMQKKAGVGIPYIMPDGGAYWQSGFNGGSGCEYVFDCLWKKFPRNYINGQRVANEYSLMAGSLYTGIVPCTFNWLATQSDTVTIQANRKETRLSGITSFLNVRSLLRSKMRVSDNYLRIGFDGGNSASVYASSVGTDSHIYICAHNYADDYGSGHYDPMPSDTVLIFGIQIFKNGTLVKDYKPHSDNGTPCLLESVGDTKIFSSGTSPGVYGLYND